MCVREIPSVTYFCLGIWYSFYHIRWLRLVGSLKLQVSFAEYRLFYTALLQKRPIISRSLLVEATPYAFDHCVLLLTPTSIVLIYYTHTVGGYRLFYRALLQKRPIILIHCVDILYTYCGWKNEGSNERFSANLK